MTWLRDALTAARTKLRCGRMRWRPFTTLCSLLLCCRAGSERTGERLPATVIPAGEGLHADWDLNGVIGTGQSLSVGAQGRPLRATRSSFDNLKLDLGLRFFEASDAGSGRLSLVPLCEPIRPIARGYSSGYPHNIHGETPHTCMASEITRLVRDATGQHGNYVSVHTVVGESGQPMSVISKDPRRGGKTGVAYERSLFETRAIARLAKAAQRSFGIGAIVLTHGESDAENADYERELLTLWRDYNRDLPKITGQSKSIPLLLTQQSSCPVDAGALARSALAALRASRAGSGISCVGPRYQYSYAEDAVHLDSLGYDRLGEKYGQVYFETVVRGRPWQSLSPLRAQREGDAIRIDFHVPVPPLVWDFELPAPHAARREWVMGRGFEVSSREQPLPITAVEIVGDTVLIRLSLASQGPLLVRYAATAAPAARQRGTFRWGQLRDSDPFVGATTKTAQPNYAVTFELEVPP